MKPFGDILITKVLHFEKIVNTKGDFWCLRVGDGPYGFWLPLSIVQTLAKRHNLKQVSALNKKLENRLIVLTIDGASVVHDLTLKADYKGPAIPRNGIERKLDLGKADFKDRRRAAARERTEQVEGVPSVTGLMDVLRSDDRW